MKTLIPKLAIISLMWLGTVSSSVAVTVRFVDVHSTNPVAPYTSFSTAATNIQDAANYAAPGDTVWVTNGIYNFGGTSLSGSNRVAIFGANTTVRSFNGPGVTTIVGYQVPGTTNGNNAVRCVYLTASSTLSGFTLTNGATQTGPTPYGGGVYCAAASCVVTNCVIVGNEASSIGGGVYGGSLVNCILKNNSVQSAGWGGGFSSGGGSSVVINSVFIGNHAGYRGGAANGGTLINCTLVGNSGQPDTCDSAKLLNCISYYNSSGTIDGTSDGCTYSNCCLPSIPTFNAGNNFTNLPLFVNLAGNDLHLSAVSPCMNAGLNGYIANSTDFDGNPRVAFGVVDLGAYEFQSPIHYVNLNSATPVSPYTNWPTAATNIQDAVNASVAGDFVVVTNGVYNYGANYVYLAMPNRVAVQQPITVVSLNGPAATIIQGAAPPLPLAIRCVYLTNGATLSGFTLTNGATMTSGDPIHYESGGGAYCESSGAVISNCVIAGNSAFKFGGGVFQGTLLNCILTNNSAPFGGGAGSNTAINCTIIRNTTGPQNADYGGGAYGCSLSNCLIVANQAVAGNAYGAGAAYSTLTTCTVSNNSSGHVGGGLFQCIAYNSLISSNRAPDAGGGSYSNTLNNCVLQNNFTFSYGGGAWAGALNNCVISNNTAQFGGGSASNVLNNCLVVSNTASATGGGLYYAVANNCLVIGNFSGNYGGGAYNSFLNNCTIVANTNRATGGGASQSTLNNCIVYYNADISGPNDVEANYEYWNGARNYCCSAPVPSFDDTLNHFMVTNEPVFVDLVNGNYHLQTNSPCINSGRNSYITNSTDYDGNARISGGTVDIGAYEIQNPPSILSYAWAQQYGFPTDGSADNADPDGDGMSNYAEWKAGTNPTNAASWLQMTTAAPTNNFTGVVVTWQSVTNVNYYLQRSSDLTTAFSTIQSNIVGNAGTTSYDDTTATNPVPYFFRIGVQ
jgi:hypothetical protein